MPLLRLLLLLTIVSLQEAGAQSIVTLSPSSNCPKGVYVDFMATLKQNTDKKAIVLNGKLFSSNDTIKKVKIIVRSIKNNLAEVLFSGNMTIGNTRSKIDNKTEAVFNQGILLNNKDFSIEMSFPIKDFNEIAALEINYQFAFSNGCVFVLRQKVKQITDY